ncbi:MAG: Fic family protein [Taibaiella sp.]|nr:Fic family protein [Taibaiella sp.]
MSRNATKSNDKRQKILDFVSANPGLSSGEIYTGGGMEGGFATVKRLIGQLLSENLLTVSGKGKATKYKVSDAYDILFDIDVDQYFLKEIDERVIKENYSHSLISEVLARVSVFTAPELQYLDALQATYTSNRLSLTSNEYKKELERLAIDLSWKSSQIEGNTYSLLETERLLKDKETAAGKTRDEAVMLLNHKDALDFIIENTTYVAPLTLASIEDIHSILMKELDVERNIRRRRVGITGTNYRPIDNEFQIKDAMRDLCALVNSTENVFSKAFLVLVLISYIQPFNDGNKRTARIVSNAILMCNHYCPISFRTIDSVEYKKAMLIFYEQNNVSAFKKIFIGQFEFAVNTYF